MRGTSNSRHRQIDAAAKAAFLAGLREGLCREDAAAAAGFSLTGFYGARYRDPRFAAEWKEALALPPAAERRAQAYAERGEVRIAPANRRLFQRRRRRNVRFDAGRRDIYVTHLAETCDSVAAAEAAGVHPATARLHRRLDPIFDAACREALAEGYVFLEAELLRLRLEAQKRLRAAIDRAGSAPPASLLAEEGAEFDRIMKLLARYDRKPHRPASNFTPGGRRQHWTFEDAIVLLDKKLRALGLRSPDPAPEEEEGEE
ncbi:MAG TPA: hypothetical protein VFP12_10880 [Allosphingosinicella sp.]|nr:hypothetical protein [Allosphingosinicella sp.]